MIINVSSDAALAAALKAAKGGDTIELSPGDYAALSISNLNPAAQVTIKSADAANPAVVHGLVVRGSSNMSFQDIEFSLTSKIEVSTSRNVSFLRDEIHGSEDGDYSNGPAGFHISQSADVSIQQSDLHDLFQGIGHLNSERLTISDNSFHDISMDGIRGGGSNYVTIARNTLTDFHRPNSEHPDAIQFWTTNTTKSAHHITIVDNVYMRGEGTPNQGIFLRDEVGNLPYLDVLIRGNLVVGALYNGIYVENGRDVVVDYNVVQGYGDYTSWIKLVGVQGGEVLFNKANTFSNPSSTSIVTGFNSTLSAATDGGVQAEALWSLGRAAKSLVGTSLPETLAGTRYADTLNGGAGADTLGGGAGNDIYVAGSDDKLTEYAGGGVDTVKSAYGHTLQANFENLVLTGVGNVSGSGNELKNVITGNTGSNALKGLQGTDTLSGGAGADTIDGGVGADRLTGGSGVDTFVFRRGDGQDVVTDFGAAGAHDVIDASDYLTAGLQATLTETTSGVTIAWSNGDKVTLTGLDVTDLHATSSGWIF